MPPLVGRMQAGTPQFQQAPPAGPERGKIIFILGIELARRHRLIRAQQAVDAHHLIGDRSRLIQQQQMIEKRIKPVLFAAIDVIDHVAPAAKLGHEDLVAQALRRVQIRLIRGQSDGELRRGFGHVAAGY